MAASLVAPDGLESPQSRALWTIAALEKSGAVSKSVAATCKGHVLAGSAGVMGAFEVFELTKDAAELASTLALSPALGTAGGTAAPPPTKSAWELHYEDDFDDAGDATVALPEEYETGSLDGADGAGGDGAEAAVTGPTTTDAAAAVGPAAVSSTVKVVLYHAKDMLAIAEAAEKLSGGAIVRKEVHWMRFKDGFPNLFIEDVKAVRTHNVAFLASLHDTKSLFEQLAAIAAIPRFLARSFLCFIPYYPTATMERSEKLGQVATANTLARLLSATPHAATGPSSICVFDVHTLSQRFYFTDNVMVRLKSCTRLLERMLRKRHGPDRVRIAFPDEGAYKRFKSKFMDYSMIVCAKQRTGDARSVRIAQGAEFIDSDDADAEYVIVDDLVQTGGTLLECAKAMSDLGAKKVNCYVTHAVFPEDSWRKFVDNPLIDTFWITDTIPTTAAKVRGVAPFQVLSIAPVLCSVMLGTSTSPAMCM